MGLVYTERDGLFRDLQEGTVAEPDGLYICPSNAELTLTQSTFHLRLQNQPPQKHLILLAMEDVTMRRAAERQVQARLNVLQHLLDALPNSVYLVQGKEARLMLANRATLSLWGASWSLGQPLFDFLESNQIHVFDPQGNTLPPASLSHIRS